MGEQMIGYFKPGTYKEPTDYVQWGSGVPLRQYDVEYNIAPTHEGRFQAPQYQPTQLSYDERQMLAQEQQWQQQQQQQQQPQEEFEETGRRRRGRMKGKGKKREDLSLMEKLEALPPVYYVAGTLTATLFLLLIVKLAKKKKKKHETTTDAS